MENYCSLQMSKQGQNEKRQIISMNGTYFGGQHAVVVSVDLSYVKKYPKTKWRFSWEELKRGCTLFKHTRHAVSLNKFIIHLINYERVYTKFNFFALIYWKDMKLGGCDIHICTNRSLASCQSFFNIRLLTSWKSLTSQITFCNVKCSRFCKIWRTDYLKENVENNRFFFKKCDVTRCWPRP